MSARAKSLRSASSPIERRMWRVLYGLRVAGYHFRKQAPIGPYVVDFACHHAKLAIEVDGSSHGAPAAERQDARRDDFLSREGYTVLRISNSDVLHNPSGVFDSVAAALEGRPRSPRGGHPLPIPPHKGEGVLTERSALDVSAPRRSTSPLVGEAGRGVAK